MENRVGLYLLKELKDLFRSNFTHRRFMVVFLHFLIRDMPFVDKDRLIELLKISGENIKQIIFQNSKKLVILTDREILASLSIKSTEIIKNAISQIENLDAERRYYTRKIKQY